MTYDTHSHDKTNSINNCERASEREREREREVFVLVPRPDLGTIKKYALLIV